MANEEQVEILLSGVDTWNEWRHWQTRLQPEVIDLQGINLRGLNLEGINLSEVNLRDANFREAILINANFRGADLKGANFTQSDLKHADFSRADLIGTEFCGADLRWSILSEQYLEETHLEEADLRYADLHLAFLEETDLIGAMLEYADLRGAHLRGADLSGAALKQAQLIDTDLRNTNFSGADLRGSFLSGAFMIDTQLTFANLSNSYIYGISVWNVDLEGAIQSNLIITDDYEPKITIDNLEIAQFIYLLLHNEKLRDVIDTVGKKAVLILGRFTEERKAVLEAIRDELRQRDYIPILFDFEKPSSRDVTETVSTLAHMARFVIADLTDAKSIPQELAQIVPHLPSVAVQPLFLKRKDENGEYERPYGMFEHWTRYPWVLPIHAYENQAGLIAELGEKVIAPAEAKVNALRQK